MIILAIETSCDETAVSVLKDEDVILADKLSSQIDLHKKYGGVVPELACRRHIEVIGPLVQEAMETARIRLDQVDAIAVTVGPGLIGALLVGLSYAKSLAYALNIPLLPVNHLEGHISAVFIEYKEIEFPAIALVVSGGHTNLYFVSKKGNYRLLGRTIDDAAGEALDKGARMLGFGYPGGPIIDQLAKNGDSEKYAFSIPYRSKEHVNFSFSGLKTALRRTLAKVPQEIRESASFREDIAAGYQVAVVESLVEKTFIALENEKAKGIILSGGVSANSFLRSRMKEEGMRTGTASYIPSPRYCTDNGAMIAMAGLLEYERGNFAFLDLNANPNLGHSGRLQKIIERDQKQRNLL
ncbi:MAG: tRNA (adenosine(37)-N6)-threonylcarbamoyltransferase complex transferase subunit TsaD [Nitrospiria bacterium]